MRYVRELEAAKPVPLAALPVLDPLLASRILSPAVTKRGERSASGTAALRATSANGIAFPSPTRD